MAPPRAADNFGQRQAITTAIKNICEYYPPNTCLRELLQNADDAGATEIEYVLDTNTYGSENLLSEGLKDFQGPALLARNNSVFRNSDFGSLSSIGDSVKTQDPTTTGKFGQGFNAVYHWTDGPWVLSRQWLLLLDPHGWWSPATGQTGGWNVVENSESIEIQNHLKTFNEFHLDHQKDLDQTIIRIPLRTEDQASRSKLFQSRIEIREITRALKEFGEEIKDGGLLFLKHIRRVIIRLNSDTLFAAEILRPKQKNIKVREQLPLDFKDMYALGSQESKDRFPFYYLSIRYTQENLSEIHRYAVQHLMFKSSDDENMDIWARSHKLFPWVAVAARLQDDFNKKPISGRLFTTLRLPMPTNLPIHAHGLFSIAPDRGRLSFTRDSSDLPTKWNTFMFNRCVSTAWHLLLLQRSAVSWQEEVFTFWPRVNPNAIEMWDKLDESVIDLAINPDCDSAIWSSCDGRCVGFTTALFAVQDEEAVTYGFALAQFRIPVVYLERPLFEKLQERTNALSLDIQLLSSRLVRQLLRSTESPLVSEENASLVLEFCLLDAIKSEHEGRPRKDVYDDLQRVSLWPALDGKRIAYCNANLLLPRNEEEMTFFKDSRASTTLDITKLSASVRKLLFGDSQCLTALVRFRGLGDLGADWPVIYPISLNERSKYWMPRVSQFDRLLRLVWNWIFERIQEGQELDASQFGNLWLIPLNDSRIRQFRPSVTNSPVLLIEPHESLFEFLGNMVSHNVAAAPPILESAILVAETVRLFRDNKRLRLDVGCAILTHADKFVDWLVEARALLSKASDLDKTNLISHLDNLTKYHKLHGNVSSNLGAQLRRLPLYSKVSCVPPFKDRRSVKSSLDSDDHLYAAPTDLPSLPDMPEVSFFSSQTSAEEFLLHRLEPFEIVSKKDIIVRHFLPWMATVSTEINDELCSVKEALVCWIIHNSLPYSKTWKKHVFSHPVIPLPLQAMKRRYRPIHGMVDPSSDLAQLYNEEEELFPCPNFFARHKESLLTYGLLSKPVWSTPLDRVRYFSQHPANTGLDKIASLLNIEVGADLLASKDSLAEIRSRKWLPGWSTHGQPVVLAPNECRGADQSHLVDTVWGTFGLSVQSTNWKKTLGWDQRSLAPFLDEVDGTFAHEHKKLLAALQISDQPSINDLRGVQNSLLNIPDGQLNPSSLGIAISVLEIATRLKYDPADLLVPDTSSRLRKIADIVHGEPLAAGDKSNFNFTHPEVSADLVRRLGVEDSSKRAIRLEIEPDTDDEEDYTPRETLETIISDTLGRYAVTDTFNEFLANADDAGATSISWMLDECDDGPHASSSLLSSELKPFQGSALFVHNDGVFTKNDFSGFKNIGQGGKKNDPTSGGMFGRGALSMYHFTDVPMLISKESFLVLDPQQQVLPIAFRRRRERRVGTKMSLTKVNHLAPDQLTPFVGLSGFDRDLEDFEGTIFRFPLRSSDTRSSLKSQHQIVGWKEIRELLEKYQDTARTALLFLRHVTTIRFSIRGHQDPEWTVSAKRLRGGGSDNFQNVEIISQAGPNKLTDVWCVGFQTITKVPPEIVRSGKGSKKTPECGIAACLIEGKSRKVKGKISVAQKEPFLSSGLGKKLAIKQKVFCRLPTNYESSLPISFNASFAVTGDRRNIALEAGVENSEWNNWLLAECIANLYLETMSYLAPRIGQGSFDYWPTGKSSDNFCENLSQAFWKVLISHDRGSNSLVPLAIQDTQLEKEDSGFLLARSQNTTSLKAARFDLLNDSDSEILRPLLRQTIPSLVRPPLARLRVALRVKSSDLQIQEVDRDCLANILRTKENSKLLEACIVLLADEVKQCFLIGTLLKLIVPEARDEDGNIRSTLNDCRIVPRPRLDLPMGLLKYQPNPDAEFHLVVTKEEESLFAFAADRMVHSGLFLKPAGISLDKTVTSHDPINILIRSEKFNIRRMTLGDVGHLLARPDSRTALHGEFQEFDTWMLKLWKYLNAHFDKICKSKGGSEPRSKATVESLCNGAGIYDKRVYRVRSNQSWAYVSPQQFTDQSCVVEPSDGQQQRLCAQFPGLLMIDPECIPSLLRKEEVDLNCARSFRRLLRAFELLDKRTTATVKTVVGLTLDSSSKTIMRNLVMSYLHSGHYDVQKDRAILRQLPIWPRFKFSPTPPQEYIAAADAQFCQYPRMLMSWVRNLASYIDPTYLNSHSDIIPKLGVSIPSLQEVWRNTRKDVPDHITSDASRMEYPVFLGYLAENKLQEVGKIAPNGDFELCEATDLYDYSDDLFAAAFREQQKTRFLHRDVRKKRIHDFLVSRGMRARNHDLIKSEHFLDCANAISRRWNPTSTSASFIQDSRTVASYLDLQKADFCNWPQATWNSLALIPMYKVRIVDPSELGYRRARMQQIVQEKTHRALKDSCNINHKRMIWSQTAFLQDKPDAFVYQKLPSGGEPNVTQVFDHLCFLVSIVKDVIQAETSEFLKDIKACYDHLQKNLESSQLIPGIHEACVWLNLDIIQLELVCNDEMEASLASSHLLCLDSPVDPLPIKVARKFLIPYEPLLKGLGCRTVTRPKSTSPEQSSDNRERSLADAMAEMLHLRDQNCLVDVYFEAQGEKKAAHKIVLAAVSDYCKRQFTGPWGNLLEHQATIHVDDLSFLTLSQMIDFAYTGDFAWPILKDPKDNDEIGKTLEMLLDLLDGTDRWLIQRLHEMVERFLISPTYVRVDTVDWVKERAEGANAKFLLKCCEDFLKENQDMVERVRAIK